MVVGLWFLCFGGWFRNGKVNEQRILLKTKNNSFL